MRFTKLEKTAEAKNTKVFTLQRLLYTTHSEYPLVYDVELRI